MLKLYRKYKALRKLKDIRDSFDKQEIHISPELWLTRNRLTWEYFDCDPKLRKLIVEILIKWRKKFPYEPRYREAKKLYDEYFTLENHIPSFENLNEGDYVVRFRSEAPIKGNRYSEYYINGNHLCKNITYRLGKFKEKYNYFDLEIDSMGEGISEDDFTSFRYATAIEVKKYVKDIAKYLDLEQQIELSNIFQAELYNLKNKIFNE